MESINYSEIESQVREKFDGHVPSRFYDTVDDIKFYSEELDKEPDNTTYKYILYGLLESLQFVYGVKV
jgi:hypothetical protein